MIVQHHDAFAFQRVDRPERGLGVEGEFRGCPIAVASLEHLIHHGVLAVVGIVDDVAFLEIAEFGARNSFDAEKFRLVELAGDERDMLGVMEFSSTGRMRDTMRSRMMMPSVELISFPASSKTPDRAGFLCPGS